MIPVGQRIDMKVAGDLGAEQQNDVEIGPGGQLLHQVVNDPADAVIAVDKHSAVNGQGHAHE